MVEGADKYYDLFGKSQQIGRLYLQLHSHARGKCFEIFLLPEGVKMTSPLTSRSKDVVEIYGMTGGQRGWTETYGWKHKGKWQDDFYEIVRQKENERYVAREKHNLNRQEENNSDKERITKLLDAYG